MRVHLGVLSLLVASCFTQASEQARFANTLALPSGYTVVVAEGDFEARSMGSFSVRLYEPAIPQDRTTFFTSGLVHPRDGAIESLALADINNDNQPDIIVIARSVGTGGYLSAYAFTVVGNKPQLHSMLSGLAADADPVASLRSSGHSN